MKRRFKSTSLFLFMFLVLLVPMFLMSAGLLSAAEVDYPSIYQLGHRFHYWTQECPSGSCEELYNYGFDNYRDFPYMHVAYAEGFREIYDVTDPKILCQRDVAGICNPQTLATELVWQSIHSGDLDYQSPIPGTFRFFIPPGTKSVVVNLFFTDVRSEYAVSYQPNPGYDGTLEDRMERLHNYAQNETILSDIGSVTVMYNSLPPGDSLSIPESGWMYIRKISGPGLQEVQIRLDLDVDVFRSWYENVTWDEDNGDPLAASGCRADDLDSCSEAECNASNYHWYDYGYGEYGCHVEPACSEAAGCPEEYCESSSFHWYAEGDAVAECHEEPKCRADNLGGCDANECAALEGDYYWHDNGYDRYGCHVEPACSEAAGCPEKYCESSNFHWYAEGDAVAGCHEEPKCRADNLGGCDANECAALEGDYYWYEMAEAEAPACHDILPACSGDSTACDTELQCLSAGFSWDQDEQKCSDQPVCSRSNLSGCTDEDSCEDMGGEWHDFHGTGVINCQPRSSSGGSSSGGSSSGGSSSGGSSSGGSSSGGSILDLLGSFFSGSSVPPADPPAVCGPDHLDLCTQDGCDDLDGYWWYDGSCRVDDRQVDYDGRIYQAPVRLGADADDGSIDAGDGLSIAVDIPAGKRGYALLVFPHDLGYYFIDSVNIVNQQLVPLTANGKQVVFEDTCASLEEFPELKGEWEVAVLTVPIAAPEFSTLDDIAAYMNGGGLYSLGTYSVSVSCRVASAAGCSGSSCANKDDCEASGGVWHNVQASGISPYCTAN